MAFVAQVSAPRVALLPVARAFAGQVLVTQVAKPLEEASVAQTTAARESRTGKVTPERCDECFSCAAAKILLDQLARQCKRRVGPSINKRLLCLLGQNFGRAKESARSENENGAFSPCDHSRVPAV